MQNGSSQIGINDTYSVDTTLSISAKDGTIYYLRGVFYIPGTSNYCGYTWNGTSWYNGPYTTNNGWQNLLAVTVTNSSWSGQLKAKIDPNDASCNASGQYAFKIERFTTSGSGNFDSQAEQTVTVVIPTSTPTPFPTPTLAPTNTPIPATATPKPTNVPTLIINKTVSTPTSALFAISPTGMATFGAVLGTASAATPTIESHPTIVAAAADKKEEVTNFSSILFILAGFCLLASCGILMALQTEKGRSVWKKFF